MISTVKTTYASVQMAAKTDDELREDNVVYTEVDLVSRR